MSTVPQLKGNCCGMAEGEKRTATVVESSPNLFTKAAEEASRLQNKKR